MNSKPLPLYPCPNGFRDCNVCASQEQRCIDPMREKMVNLFAYIKKLEGENWDLQYTKCNECGHVNSTKDSIIRIKLDTNKPLDGIIWDSTIHVNNLELRCILLELLRRIKKLENPHEKNIN